MLESLTTAPSATPEQFVRAFAAEYPTPNVLRALAYCESGRLEWAQVSALFGRSLAAGVAAVREA